MWSRPASLALLVISAGCGARAAAPPPIAAAPAALVAPPMSDADWQACAARIPRTPLGGDVVAIRMTPALAAAVAPDDACLAASMTRDNSLYGAVRDVATKGLPYMLVGRDGAPPRIEYPLVEDVGAGEVVVKLPRAMTTLGCHPVAAPDWGHVVRAEVPSQPPPGTLYWIAPTDQPVRFVRDEWVGYDRCHVIRTATEALEVPAGERVGALLRDAVAGVDFSRQMVIFDPADVEDRLLAVACEVIDPPADADRDRDDAYRPRCVDRPTGLEVTMWRDIDPPCQGNPTPPDGPTGDSHWRPRRITPLVIVPRRAGPVTRIVVDTAVSPPCA